MNKSNRSKAKVVSCGVDYFTCTRDEVNSGGDWLRRCESIAHTEFDKGNEVKPWGMSGYRGFLCGQLQCGRRPQSNIVRLSGGLANEEWWGFYEQASSVTRVDFQVTVLVPCDPSQEVATAFHQMKRHQKGRKDGPTLTLWRDTMGGATCYVGKRSSRYMGRIYNKEVESGRPEFKSCLRLETEIKGKACIPAIERLLCSETVVTGVLDGVSQFFTSRGYPPAYEAGSLHLTKCPRITTNVEAKLLWLQNQVRPSVERLIARGYEEEVYDCLGLSKAGPCGPSAFHDRKLLSDWRIENECTQSGA